VRFTIERIRTIVLIAGILLVATLGVFLAIGHWKSPFNRRDLPKRLGIDIQQEANGFTHAEFHAGHAVFKITASKVEQLKNDRYLLHTVKIEMYNPNDGGPKDGGPKDGGHNRSNGGLNGGTDRIEGSEFEYDQNAGIATAAGPVEITLDRPERPQSAAQKKKAAEAGPDKKKQASALPPDPNANQIHVKTVGLVFNQNSGVASSSSHVDFNLPQGSGSAMGASYDSQNGKLILNRAVELNTQRGHDLVKILAQHAEFDRDDNLCNLVDATARYRRGDAHAQRAVLQFREDGTAQQLDATSGFVLTTATGGRLAAQAGSLQFNQNNQPSAGKLEGGVTIDSVRDGRTVHGTAPSADLQFSAAGQLRHAHLERNVSFSSDEQSENAGVSQHGHRVWTSPVADLDFRDAGNGQVELDRLHGVGGVVVTSESQRGAAPATHARLASEDLKGTFGPNSALETLTGIGHASLEQLTAIGAHQTTTGDRLEAHFTSVKATDAKANAGPTGAAQIDTATMTGNVVLIQQAAAKSGLPASAPGPAQLRATAQRADYEGAGELLHLTGRPHIEDGGLDLDADKVDVARTTGDAFAHGDVKASWFGDDASSASKQTASGGALPSLGAGGQGPTHVVSDEAQLHQTTGEATFRGHARLWQQSNSVAAPVIVLDRTKQTLIARANSVAEPVKVVLVSASGAGPGKASQTGQTGQTNKTSSPSVIRVRGGDLKYSNAERKAIMQAGALGSVVTETADATTRSNEVELTLLPPGNHAGKDGAAAQVDRMTARGDVHIDSQGRSGVGAKLEYSNETGNYVLTGTAAAPPRMNDPTRGTVTGESLIFSSRDGSVNVEGGERATAAETTTPKRR
jgi:lipopolysaccharide export system protein LptA